MKRSFCLYLVLPAFAFAGPTPPKLSSNFVCFAHGADNKEKRLDFITNLSVSGISTAYSSCDDDLIKCSSFSSDGFSDNLSSLVTQLHSANNKKSSAAFLFATPYNTHLFQQDMQEKEQDDSVTAGLQEQAKEKEDNTTPGFQEEPKEKEDNTTPGLQEEPKEQEDNVTPGFQEEPKEQEDNVTPGFQEEPKEQDDSVTPGLQEEPKEKDDSVTPGLQEEPKEQDDNVTPGFQEGPKEKEDNTTPGFQEEPKEQEDNTTSGLQEEPKEQEDNVTPGLQEEPKEQEDNVTPGLQEEPKEQDDNVTPGLQTEEKERVEQPEQGLKTEITKEQSVDQAPKRDIHAFFNKIVAQRHIADTFYSFLAPKDLVALAGAHRQTRLKLSQKNDSNFTRVRRDPREIGSNLFGSFLRDCFSMESVLKKEKSQYALFPGQKAVRQSLSSSSEPLVLSRRGELLKRLFSSENTPLLWNTISQNQPLVLTLSQQEVEMLDDALPSIKWRQKLYELKIPIITNDFSLLEDSDFWPQIVHFCFSVYDIEGSEEKPSVWKFENAIHYLMNGSIPISVNGAPSGFSNNASLALSDEPDFRYDFRVLSKIFSAANIKECRMRALDLMDRPGIWGDEHYRFQPLNVENLQSLSLYFSEYHILRDFFQTIPQKMPNLRRLDLRPGAAFYNEDFSDMPNLHLAQNLVEVHAPSLFAPTGVENFWSLFSPKLESLTYFQKALSLDQVHFIADYFQDLHCVGLNLDDESVKGDSNQKIRMTLRERMTPFVKHNNLKSLDLKINFSIKLEDQTPQSMCLSNQRDFSMMPNRFAASDVPLSFSALEDLTIRGTGFYQGTFASFFQTLTYVFHTFDLRSVKSITFIDDVMLSFSDSLSKGFAKSLPQQMRDTWAHLERISSAYPFIAQRVKFRDLTLPKLISLGKEPNHNRYEGLD